MPLTKLLIKALENLLFDFFAQHVTKTEACVKRKRITTNLTNPYFILATFRTCFFSPFSSFNDEKIKLQGLK